MKNVMAFCCVLMLGIAMLMPLGCSDDIEGHATATGEEARDKPYVASILRDPFHRSTCKWAKKIHEDNLQGYDTCEQAKADGHRPCKVCKP